MQFLGTLGIDVHILLAQIANFGILLLALTYFVYKPTIKAIEENERALVEGSELKRMLADEKQSFEARQQETAKSARERSRRAVKELAAMTETIKRSASDSAKAESTALIDLTRGIIESERGAMAREVAEEERRKVAGGFKISFEMLVPEAYRSQMQEVVWKLFLENLGTADLKRVTEDDARELRELQQSDPGRYEKLLRQKLGMVLLESAILPSPHERAEAEQVVAQKIGWEVALEARQNPGLICGVRLEIQGRLIESSLSNMLAQHD